MIDRRGEDLYRFAVGISSIVELGAMSYFGYETWRKPSPENLFPLGISIGASILITATLIVANYRRYNS